MLRGGGGSTRLYLLSTSKQRENISHQANTTVILMSTIPKPLNDTFGVRGREGSREMKGGWGEGGDTHRSKQANYQAAHQHKINNKTLHITCSTHVGQMDRGVRTKGGNSSEFSDQTLQPFSDSASLPWLPQLPDLLDRIRFI